MITDSRALRPHKLQRNCLWQSFPGQKLRFLGHTRVFKLCFAAVEPLHAPKRTSLTSSSRQERLEKGLELCVKPKKSFSVLDGKADAAEYAQKYSAAGKKRQEEDGKQDARKQTSTLDSRKLTKRQKERATSETPQRLAKVIAQAGIASRRKAEELVAAGAVKVNDKVVTVPQHMVWASIDKVVVSGSPLPRVTRKYYFALNKPKGFLCANKGSKEPGQQRLVVDLFQAWIDKSLAGEKGKSQAVFPRLFTVGRLDVQTTGLLFVTNDGEWAQTVQHPSSNVTKEYVVTLPKPPTAQQIQTVIDGCMVDGAFVQPKSVSYAANNRRDKLRVVVGEGRNREVRVLMENAGVEVSQLKRVRIGGYKLPSDLSIGDFRELKPYMAKRVVDKSIELNPQTNPTLRTR